MDGSIPGTDGGAKPREALLIEAAQKDPRRFAELYEENFERVYAFVVRRVRNRAEAEDLTAQVFHQALDKLKSFEWRGAPFAAWLYRIAANAIADHFHDAARGAEAGPLAADDEELAQVERRATLDRLVNALPADQRRVIAMRFVEERSIREIAQAIGRSEGAVKQLQFRALQNLRMQMGQSHG